MSAPGGSPAVVRLPSFGSEHLEVDGSRTPAVRNVRLLAVSATIPGQPPLPE
jgi:hypothetical protein